MNIPTVAVTVTVRDQQGEPIPDVLVGAVLSEVERYEGVVVPLSHGKHTNTLGTVVFHLFPNELGAEGSHYEFTFFLPEGKTYKVYAVVPNIDCNLEDISSNEFAPLSVSVSTINLFLQYLAQMASSVGGTSFFGNPGISPDVSTLLNLLKGELTKDQLVSDLASEIDLISGPIGLPNSVAARIEEERLARVEAIEAEASARGTAITEEKIARETEDENLAQSIELLTSKTDENLAAIESEQIARTTADSAMAADINTLFSGVENANADISSLSLTMAEEDAALATRIDNLSATVGTNKAEVQSELSAVSNEVTTVASRIDTVQNQVEGNLSSVQVLSQSVSGIKAEYTIKAQVVTSDGKAVISGIGLVADASSNQSEIAFLADYFRFVTTNDQNNLVQPFVVTEEGIGISGQIIAQSADAINSVVDTSALGDFGDLAYEDVVELAKLGTTIIEGGYIKAELINANALVIGNLTGQDISESVESWRYEDTTSIDGGKIHASSSITIGDLAGGDYCLLTDGEVKTFRNLEDEARQTKELRQWETGWCYNADPDDPDSEWTELEGYYVSEPQLFLTPKTLQTFKNRSTLTDQYLDMSVYAIELIPGHTNRYRFKANARLIASAGSGSVAVNQTTTNTSTTATYSTSTKTTPDEVVALTVTADFYSVRGTGTSGLYYKRKICWQLYVDGIGKGWSDWYTISSLNAIRLTKSVTSLTSGSHSFYIETSVADYDGSTFSTGTTTEYTTNTKSANTVFLDDYNDPSDYTSTYSETFSFTVPSNTLSGWTLQSVKLTGNFTLTVENLQGSQLLLQSVSMKIDGSSIGYSSAGWDNPVTVVESVSNYPLSVGTHSLKLSFSAGQYMKHMEVNYVLSGTYTYTYSRLKPGTSTVENKTVIVSYDYTLGDIDVLAEGTVNYMALGE